MKYTFLLYSCIALLTVSCKKAQLEPLPKVTANTTTEANTAVKSKGYITVQCETCKVEYGMPDQYKGINVTGTSDKLYFDYTNDYYLKTYITAFQRSQKLTLTVYNKDGQKVFSDSNTQSTTGFWDTYVLVRDKTN
ncbi:hypothetical protein [Mucilaginibacter lacusdianchii]|uniref:hypothetical protein n=1 Tax=Mucilaginibacter lacusdianchii TaxID=2684211 RepID=UPI00131C0334|nr:hypothetical protein [Mucilaginibacter sp. JXJ CY 39]